ncbi:uncharacterized protein RAG0_02815 [Rhynchosporium agropyri]|uniref:GAG-pre-integrase domain-containing protein n=1 Tax=Rhynchosporium agropyri TaxID=914238 RepID=A0A1E1K2R2_9HELO|nr:uncharacterized protein RAG0_02815 [Rhynchosporium agropyri]
MIPAVNFDDNVWKWHRRLGHLRFQSMRTLLRHSDGIDLTDTQIKAKLKAICPVCAVTKALVHFPREPAKRRATNESYVNKGDVVDVFKKLHKRSEQSEGIIIRAYRFDGEFQVGEITNWLERKNIRIEPTITYQLYMNGVAERGMRTLREKAAIMMQEAHLSFKDKKTPWESRYGSKPTFGRERIWDSRAYVTLPPAKGRVGRDRALKIHEPRGWLGYFVGCEAESICLVYSEEKHRIFRLGVARVEDGEGLMDNHDSPTTTDRLAELRTVIPDTASDEASDEAPDEDDDLNDLDHNEDLPDTFPSSQPNLDFMENDILLQSDQEIDNDDFGHTTAHIEESSDLNDIYVFDPDSDEEEDPPSGNGETVSKYFAGLAFAKGNFPPRNFEADAAGADLSKFSKCSRCFLKTADVVGLHAQFLRRPSTNAVQ